MKLSRYLLLSFLFVGFFACGSDPEPAQTPAPATPTLAPNAQTAPQTGTTVALNPPHGQPGHDCAIAVGGPLDGSGAPRQAPQIDMSKMGNTAAQPNMATPAGNAPANSGNLNPAHGQPGHRCDIAVGAPLN